MKTTTREIIVNWLKWRIADSQFVISSHNIEGHGKADLIPFGKNFFGMSHNPSTYSRAWRLLKEDGSIPEANITHVQTITHKPEAKWRLLTT